MIYFKNYRDCGYTCNPRKFEIPALRFPRKVSVNPCKHLQCTCIQKKVSSLDIFLIAPSFNLETYSQNTIIGICLWASWFLDVNLTNFDQPLMNSITDLTLLHNDHIMIKEKNNTCRGLQIACFINGHSHAKDHSLLHKNYTLTYIMQNMYVKFFPFFLYKKENSQKRSLIFK